MPKLKINGRPVAVKNGATVLEAAEQVSVEIPTLCHLEGMLPQSACMLCVVKEVRTGRILPSCSTRAEEGMEIDTDGSDVRGARRDMLNLILSDHAGDCEAPCARICPARLPIPQMLRALQGGRAEAAARIALRELAIPAILGFLCKAPCEKGCRRTQIDRTLPIRDLHRQLALDFASLPFRFPDAGKRAAVHGSGAAGLACAWHLRMAGWQCTVFDEQRHPGGTLRDEPNLPSEVLDVEIERLRSAGIEFRMQTSFPARDDGFDALLEPKENPLAVLSVATGRKAAEEAVRRATSAPENPKPFHSRFGALRDSELREWMRTLPEPAGASAMAQDAARCLHCDCRKRLDCKLREYAQEYGARQQTYPAMERHHLRWKTGSRVVFEEGKCIRCGRCVRITERAGVRPGLAFIGRSSSVRVDIPFEEPLDNALQGVDAECIDACPTAALAWKEETTP